MTWLDTADGHLCDARRQFGCQQVHSGHCGAGFGSGPIESTMCNIACAVCYRTQGERWLVVTRCAQHSVNAQALSRGGNVAVLSPQMKATIKFRCKGQVIVHYQGRAGLLACILEQAKVLPSNTHRLRTLVPILQSGQSLRQQAFANRQNIAKIAPIGGYCIDALYKAQ